ncbi:MAG: hypothetical protein ACRDTG_32210 [Pseudonocardiaceae bacterium]
MTFRPNVEVTHTRLVPQPDCTGCFIWIREEVAQVGDDTTVTSRTVFRPSPPSARTDNREVVNRQQSAPGFSPHDAASPSGTRARESPGAG